MSWLGSTGKALVSEWQNGWGIFALLRLVVDKYTSPYARNQDAFGAGPFAETGQASKTECAIMTGGMRLFCLKCYPLHRINNSGSAMRLFYLE